MTEQFRWCAGCDVEQVFMAPPCQDGHGLDCLDLACVECGHAIVVGLLIVNGEQSVLVAAA
jgi:hypothetical protein